MDERGRGRGREGGLVESRRCGGCYVLAQRPRSKLVSTREGREEGKGGRLESPLSFITEHTPKDIVLVLKILQDIPEHVAFILVQRWRGPNSQVEIC